MQSFASWVSFLVEGRVKGKFQNPYLRAGRYNTGNFKRADAWRRGNCFHPSAYGKSGRLLFKNDSGSGETMWKLIRLEWKKNKVGKNVGILCWQATGFFCRFNRYFFWVCHPVHLPGGAQGCALGDGQRNGCTSGRNCL